MILEPSSLTNGREAPDDISGRSEAVVVAVVVAAVVERCNVMTLLSTPWLRKLKLTFGSTLCLSWIKINKKMSPYSDPY